MEPDLSEARAQIIAELEAVEATALQGSASAETVERDQSSMGRVSRIDALQQQVLAKGLQERLDQRRRKLADLAAHFTGKGPWKKRLPQIIDTLEALGRVRRDAEGRMVG